jgi:hypothetical protein
VPGKARPLSGRTIQEIEREEWVKPKNEVSDLVAANTITIHERDKREIESQQ